MEKRLGLGKIDSAIGVVSLNFVLLEHCPILHHKEVMGETANFPEILLLEIEYVSKTRDTVLYRNFIRRSCTSAPDK